jgi:uncharacterized protein (TIGR00299 family) protein
MGTTLYLDCSQGISGDMCVGALIDCGVDVDGLKQALFSLGVDGFEVVVSHKSAGALVACDFDVLLDEAHDGHDHDMAYLYGHLAEAGADDEREAEFGHHHHHHHHHQHDDAPGHVHEHAHDHHHDTHGHAHHHHHEHRGLADCLRIIDVSSLSARAKATAQRIFQIVAEAEAAAHGTSIEEVHFHEVGAVDSIVDIAAVAYCLDALDVTDAVLTPLGEGHGSVRSAHGILPIPVPAVSHIVSAHQLAMAPRDVQGELVTPTGAAIAAAIRSSDALPHVYTIKASGLGVGKRAYNPPSTVRALLLEPSPTSKTPDANDAQVKSTAPLNTALASLPKPQLWKLECEVDDCSGEALGYALDLLYEAGAREAHFLPVYMKKNRPGYQIELLCDEERIPEMERILFEHTTTIGIRRTPQWRCALARQIRQVSTTCGDALAKAVVLPDGRERLYPEHDSVVALAAQAGLSYQDAYRSVLCACTA